MIKGIIFDLDGVLIDSQSVMKVAFEYAFSCFFQNNVPPWEEYISHSGKGFNAIMDQMGLPQGLAEPFNRKSTELIPEIKVFEGTKRLLTVLKEYGCYLGIATGKNSIRTKAILEQKAILHFFDLVVCSDEVTKGKPSPHIVEKHFANSGFIAQDFIYIGDSVSDIRCANAAGINSIAVLWGLGKKEDLIKEKPTFIVGNMATLEGIIISNILPYAKPA